MSLFETGIRPSVDAWLLAESKKVRSYGDYWSASSAGYCQRKNIFQRLGVPPVKEDARKQRVFTAGHIFHDWIQGITKNAGLSIASEVELQDEDLMILGHFDDLVLIGPTKDEITYAARQTGKVNLPKSHLILYDYKTVNSRSFTWAKQNGNTMSYYHRMQLGTYMYMLRNTPPKKYMTEPLIMPDGSTYDRSDSYIRRWPDDINTKTLTEARILKISKDDLRMSEQQLLWSDDLAKEVIDYWLELNDWWLKKKIPPCTCADHENGFLAKEAYNDFYYEDEPCSLKWYEKCKSEGLLKEVT